MWSITNFLLKHEAKSSHHHTRSYQLSQIMKFGLILLVWQNCILYTEINNQKYDMNVECAHTGKREEEGGGYSKRKKGNERAGGRHTQERIKTNWLLYYKCLRSSTSVISEHHTSVMNISEGVCAHVHTSVRACLCTYLQTYKFKFCEGDEIERSHTCHRTQGINT